VVERQSEVVERPARGAGTASRPVPTEFDHCTQCSASCVEGHRNISRRSTCRLFSLRVRKNRNRCTSDVIIELRNFISDPLSGGCLCVIPVRPSVCLSVPCLCHSRNLPTHHCADVPFNWRRPAAATGSQLKIDIRGSNRLAVLLTYLLL